MLTNTKGSGGATTPAPPTTTEEPTEGTSTEGPTTTQGPTSTTTPHTTNSPLPTDHQGTFLYIFVNDTSLGKYPYDEVLAESLLFYEAERSGPLPYLNRCIKFLYITTNHIKGALEGRQWTG